MANTYLVKTPSSAGNRKTFTISTWLKRSKLSYSYAYIITAGEYNQSQMAQLKFHDGDELNFSGYNSGGSQEFRIKTNKKFRFSSPFGERMLAPIDHLHNCEFNVYALQLSMYAYMYEKLTGKKCRKCVIFYLKDDSFRAYHVNYLKSDIVALLNHYKINTLNG